MLKLAPQIAETTTMAVSWRDHAPRENGAGAATYCAAMAVGGSAPAGPALALHSGESRR